MQQKNRLFQQQQQIMSGNIQPVAKNEFCQHKMCRVQFQQTHYASYVFAATMLPLINVLILFTQSYSLSWDSNFADIQRKSFNYYYIGVSYYFASILIFTLSSANTHLPLKDLLRLYLLMDSNQICVIASNICYVCLHLIYLCSDVSGGSGYRIFPVDVVYLTVFVVNNFAFLGHFRVSLVHFKWSKRETLTFKILVFASSLCYFAYGILIIVGKDSLSMLLTQANNLIQGFITSSDFGALTTQVQAELIQQMNQLASNVSVIQNLINLFVFTSFANICEVLSRMNDFDRSSNLEPKYEIDDQEDQNKPRLEHLKLEIDNKIGTLHEKLNSMMAIKQAIKSFIPNLPTPETETELTAQSDHLHL